METPEKAQRPVRNKAPVSEALYFAAASTAQLLLTMEVPAREALDLAAAVIALAKASRPVQNE